MLPLQRLALILWLVTRSSKSEHYKLNSPASCHVRENYYTSRSIEKFLTNSNTPFVIYQNNITSNHQTVFLEWTKLFPDGYVTNVNYTAINHYKNVIDTLLLNGLEPVLALHSGDLPQLFGPLGGWTNPIIVQYFANYARQVFKFFGNRVKTWITFHEPKVICESFKGLIGDEFPLGVAEYWCAHNILNAHAEAAHIYDKGFRTVQKGTISIALDVVSVKPANATDVKDTRAADQKLHFEFGLFANPILNFDYPSVVIDRVSKRSKLEGFGTSRLPQFTYTDKKRISGTYDYLQINLYNCINVIGAKEEEPPTTPNIKIDSGGKVLEIKEKWTDESAILHLINWIKNTYDKSNIILVQKECGLNSVNFNN